MTTMYPQHQDYTFKNVALRLYGDELCAEAIKNIADEQWLQRNLKAVRRLLNHKDGVVLIAKWEGANDTQAAIDHIQAFWMRATTEWASFTEFYLVGRREYIKWMQMIHDDEDIDNNNKILFLGEGKGEHAYTVGYDAGLQILDYMIHNKIEWSVLQDAG